MHKYILLFWEVPNLYVTKSSKFCVNISCEAEPRTVFLTKSAEDNLNWLRYKVIKVESLRHAQSIQIQTKT